MLENLNMAEPLLSRFDLVFILLDASDEQRDRHLSEHVMALHSGEGGSRVTVQLMGVLWRGSDHVHQHKVFAN